MKDCIYFDECSAPLCPLSDESLQYGTWFPDEEICRKNLGLEWVKRQKKIKKKATNFGECFTKNMLEHNCKLTIKGINPDCDRKPQIKKWFEIHKKKKSLSQEEKKQMRDRFEAVRLKKGVNQ